MAWTLLTITAIALSLGAPQAHGVSSPPTVCADYRTAVPAAAHGAAFTIAGELCGVDPANRRLVLITAHGATYNRGYWDWPQDPDRYSFVRNLPPRVSVLNIDLIGSGQSSRPLSVEATQDAQARALHHLVSDMRVRGFERVVLIGHSSGSGSATLAAATYRDVDGLIVTGFLHRFAPPPQGLAVPASLHPAGLDPSFAGHGLDPGYLTTRPGARSNPGFYFLDAADPEVIAFDDAHKDVVPAPQAAGFVAIVNDSSVSRAVEVPVLSVQGSHDVAFCDTPDCPQAAEEAAAWSAAAELELHVIDGAGHNIHLHRAAASLEFSIVREWLARRFL